LNNLESLQASILTAKGYERFEPGIKTLSKSTAEPDALFLPSDGPSESGEEYPALGNYLLTGQSWMSGRLLNLQPYVAAGAGAQLFGNDYVLKTMADKIDDPTGQVDIISRDNGAGGSSWPIICSRLLAANGTKPLVIIPAAKGGSSMAEWQPGADHENRATLYGSAVYRARQIGDIAANLCLEGQSDAVAGTSKALFKSRFRTFSAAIRADLGCKTILGKFPYPTDAATLVGVPTIYAAIDELWAEDPNVIRGPDLSDVITDDTLHITSDLKGSHEADLWVPYLQANLGQTQGVLPEANGVIHSNTFDQWTLTNCTVTANVAEAPLAGYMADRMTMSGGAGLKQVLSPTITAQNAQSRVYGFRVKAETGVQFVQLYGSSGILGVGNFNNFDIINGLATANGSSDYMIRALGDGWFEITVRRTTVGAGGHSVAINIVGTASSTRAATDGPTSGSLLLACFQAQARNSMSPYLDVA
jgi:hypothetical protein